VTLASHHQKWFQRYFEFHCHDCGSGVGFRSRPRTFSERCLLPILLLRPVRCAECFRRDYRFLLTPVKDRLPEKLRKMPAPPEPTNRNVA
jgi:hypothetical protein